MGRLAAISGCEHASPEVQAPARSRPKITEHIRERTIGRGGVEFNMNKHAGRRSLSMPTCKSVNRMKIVDAFELESSAAYEKELHWMDKRAATYFEKVTFCIHPLG